MQLRTTMRYLLVAVCLVLINSGVDDHALATGAVQDPPEETTQPAPNIDDAHDLLREGYYDRAREAYEQLSEAPEHRVEAQIGLARCRIRTGEYQEAIAGLNLLSAEESADWHFVMAGVLRIVGQYDDALQHVESAIKIDEEHGGARWLRAQLLEYLGRRLEAVEKLRWFERRATGRQDLPYDAEKLTNLAQGFLRYSILTRANVGPRTVHVLQNMLQQAYGRVDRTYWPARIAAADLLRARHNNDDIEGSVSDYKAALNINSNLPEAHVGLGAVALEGWKFEETERRVDLALSINPNFSPAIRLLASKFITERRYEQAIEACDRALKINPNDVDALGLSASASACMYDDERVQALAERAREINPTPATFYRALGDALGGIRQYAASQEAYLKAIEYDPSDANARTELGMMYMQWGEEDKARDALDAAWVLDEFNQQTKHTLDLLDQLDDFTNYESEHFIVGFNRTKDPGLGELLSEYLESIHGAITEDYATELTDKTMIEVFPTQKAFGVRITGKPWIATVGACTGRVIALASSRKGPELTFGTYNLARVLKHEYTHTVTLAATKNRIPHWMTEGLAVYQEDSPRRFEWAEQLSETLRRDRLFTLESINWGFVRPKRPGDRQLAYAQSEWMCEYIVDRFGYDSINKMLARYREGQTQPVVFDELFDITLEDFDQDFKGWAMKQAQTWGFNMTPPEKPLVLKTLLVAKPQDAEVRGRLARAYFDSGDFKAAGEMAKEAIKLDENEPVALEIKARIFARQIRRERNRQKIRGMQDEVLPELRRLNEVDPDNWTALKMLGGFALWRGNQDVAIEHFQRLQRLCPLDPVSWRGLSGIYLKRGEQDLALPQLLELARTEESDADIPGELGRIYSRKNNLREAQYWLRQALYINPFSVNWRSTLADVNMRAGDTEAALKQYTFLTKSDSRKADHFANAAFAANKIGDKEKTQSFAKQAVKLDPKSPAKALIKS